MKRIFFLVTFFSVLVFPHKAFAVTISVDQYPSSISQDPFTVNVSISGASEGQNYLRVDLYKEGTSNYFGETFNGSDWYGESDGKSYSSVTVDSSKTASAHIQARIGTPSVTEFPGAGTYKLRIRRYTTSGNQASNDQQTPVNIEINYALPTPTSTPSPTPKPTNTPIPSKTPTPIKTPTPTTKPSSVSTKVLTVTPVFKNPTSPEFAKSTNKNSEIVPSSILGESTESSAPTTTKEKENQIEALGGSDKKIPVVLLILGAIISFCAILVAFLLFKRKNNKDEL